MDIHLAARGVDIEVDVRLVRRGDRWVAVATLGADHRAAIAATPHGALRASVAFLGPETVAMLLANPELMAPSAAIR